MEMDTSANAKMEVMPIAKTNSMRVKPARVTADGSWRLIGIVLQSRAADAGAELAFACQFPRCPAYLHGEQAQIVRIGGTERCGGKRDGAGINYPACGIGRGRVVGSQEIRWQK